MSAGRRWSSRAGASCPPLSRPARPARAESDRRSPPSRPLSECSTRPVLPRRPSPTGWQRRRRIVRWLPCWPDAVSQRATTSNSYGLCWTVWTWARHHVANRGGCRDSRIVCHRAGILFPAVSEEGWLIFGRTAVCPFCGGVVVPGSPLPAVDCLPRLPRQSRDSLPASFRSH